MLTIARKYVWFRLHVSSILPVHFSYSKHRHSTRPLFYAIINRRTRNIIWRRPAAFDGLSLAVSAAKSDTTHLCDVTRHIRAPRAALDNKQALLPYTAFSIQTVRHSGYMKNSLWGADWVMYSHFSIQMDNLVQVDMSCTVQTCERHTVCSRGVVQACELSHPAHQDWPFATLQNNVNI